MHHLLLDHFVMLLLSLGPVPHILFLAALRRAGPEVISMWCLAATLIAVIQQLKMLNVLSVRLTGTSFRLRVGLMRLCYGR